MIRFPNDMLEWREDLPKFPKTLVTVHPNLGATGIEHIAYCRHLGGLALDMVNWARVW